MTLRSRLLIRRWLRSLARRGVNTRRYFEYYRVSSAVNRGCRRAARRGYVVGLVPTSTTGGVHSPTSFHSLHKAVDLGLIEREIGTAVGLWRLIKFQRAEFKAWQEGKRPHLLELIGPDDRCCVLRARHATLVHGSALEIQHRNHVHQAYSA